MYLLIELSSHLLSYLLIEFVRNHFIIILQSEKNAFLSFYFFKFYLKRDEKCIVTYIRYLIDS